MQKRGQVSPDDEDALALTLAQIVAPAKVEEREERFGGYGYPRTRSVDAMSPQIPRGMR